MKLLNRGVKSLMTMSPSAQYIDAIPFGLRMQNYTRSTQPFCVVMKKNYMNIAFFMFRCLPNKYRRWTVEDMMDAYSDALYRS